MYDFSSFIQHLDKTNQSRLKKLKINNLLALIITHVPKSYIDTTLTPTLTPHSNVLIKVHIHDTKTLGFGKNARLSIYATMSDFNQPLEMIIFHPKPFHKKIFSEDSTHYVFGKLEN